MILIYVICHDENSNGIAQKNIDASPIENVTYKIVQVSNTNQLFESQIFLYLDEHKEEWMDKSYVGIITYSFWKKTFGRNITLQSAIQTLKDCKNEIDVMPLYSIQFIKRLSYDKSVPITFYDSIGILHGSNAVLLLHNICNVVLGCKYEDVKNVCDQATPFMCNWWFAKPIWMSKYIEFFKMSLKFVQGNDLAKKLISSHAFYQDEKIDIQQMYKLFDKPYYTLYPFIFERLPIIYFQFKKANIKHLDITFFGT